MSYESRINYLFVTRFLNAYTTPVSGGSGRVYRERI